MARRLSTRQLLAILKRYGAIELPKGRGKGSHRMMARNVNGTVHKTPIPQGRDVVAPGTVMSIRRKLKLTQEDGVSNDEFFGV